MRMYDLFESCKYPSRISPSRGIVVILLALLIFSKNITFSNSPNSTRKPSYYTKIKMESAVSTLLTIGIGLLPMSWKEYFFSLFLWSCRFFLFRRPILMRRWTIWSHPWRTVPLRLSCSAIVWIHWIRYPQVLDCQRLIWGVKMIRWPRILLSLTWNRIHRCSLFLYSFFYVVNVEFGIKCLLLSLLLLSVNLFVLWSFVLRIVYYFSFLILSGVVMSNLVLICFVILLVRPERYSNVLGVNGEFVGS